MTSGSQLLPSKTAQIMTVIASVATAVAVYSVENKDLKVFIPEDTLKLRNDCQVGTWRTGDESIGKEMDLVVVNVKRFIGGLGKTKLARWLQVWLVPISGYYQNCLAVTYIKTQSLERLNNKLVHMASHGIHSSQLIFRTSFEQRQSDLGKYYVLTFQEREPTDREQQLIQEIRTIDDSILVDPDSTVNMIDVSQMSNAEKQAVYVALQGFDVDDVRTMVKTGIVETFNRLVDQPPEKTALALTA